MMQVGIKTYLINNNLFAYIETGPVNLRISQILSVKFP